ncbi:MAG: DUF3095 family protein [Micropepsaceae bacterium]
MDAQTVASFAEALDPANYVSLPSDWFVAVGDVVQSTNAIQAGRYKDVNLAGAATIAGILNACPGRELPFAFGGDGGVVLVPGDLSAQAKDALKGVQKVARNALSLDIRCALIPVGAVRAQGRDVKLAYQTLAGKRKLAMMSGGGIDCAEAICKSPEASEFLVTADATATDADLAGLSCRWKPLQAQRGVMVSAIVRAKDHAASLPRVYRDIYDGIQRVLLRDACPVAVSNLRSAWPPHGGAKERAFGRTLFEVYGQSLLGLISEKTGITIGGFNGQNYVRALPSHSDYRKFADSLRMVVDCSTREADGIESILKDSKAAGLIDFGLHRASTALMTCFVSSTDDGGHVHFIDGGDGGYAMAAQDLKSRSPTAV